MKTPPRQDGGIDGRSPSRSDPATILYRPRSGIAYISWPVRYKMMDCPIHHVRGFTELSRSVIQVLFLVKTLQIIDNEAQFQCVLGQQFCGQQSSICTFIQIQLILTSHFTARVNILWKTRTELSLVRMSRWHCYYFLKLMNGYS